MFLRDGLNKQESPEMKYKKLARGTSSVFAQFCMDRDKLLKHEFDVKELYEEFLSLDNTEDGLTQNMFTKYLREYTKVFKLAFHKRKSDGKTFIAISQ